MKLKLEDVIDAIEMASDGVEYYFSKEKGEIVVYTDPLITGIEDDELAEELEENVDEYIRLPTKFDVNEYSIMEQFIWSLPEGKMQDSLERAIRGRGAFRNFKDKLESFGIVDEWYVYEANTFKRIAIAWCENKNIEYT
ncbi:UPF0158 family protein [Paenibacillus yanchengensis]|uniref:UPF0158 family protein n=1 Tax=Paenibacillus yanchengensis TaxID=2035833 RepID=A0ABW4YHH5_9BACL